MTHYPVLHWVAIWFVINGLIGATWLLLNSLFDDTLNGRKTPSVT